MAPLACSWNSLWWSHSKKPTVPEVYLLVYTSPIVFNFPPTAHLLGSRSSRVGSDSSSGLVPASTWLPSPAPLALLQLMYLLSRGHLQTSLGGIFLKVLRGPPRLQRVEASVTAAFSDLTEPLSSQRRDSSISRQQGHRDCLCRTALQRGLCWWVSFLPLPGAPSVSSCLISACLNCTSTRRFITVVHSAQVLGVFKKAEQFSLFLLQVRRSSGLKKWPISQRALRFPCAGDRHACVLTGRLRRLPAAPLWLSRHCFCDD